LRTAEVKPIDYHRGIKSGIRSEVPSVAVKALRLKGIMAKKVNAVNLDLFLDGYREGINRSWNAIGNPFELPDFESYHALKGLFIGLNRASTGLTKGATIITDELSEYLNGYRVGFTLSLAVDFSTILEEAFIPFTSSDLRSFHKGLEAKERTDLEAEKSSDAAKQMYTAGLTAHCINLEVPAEQASDVANLISPPNSLRAFKKTLDSDPRFIEKEIALLDNQLAEIPVKGFVFKNWSGLDTDVQIVTPEEQRIEDRKRGLVTGLEIRRYLSPAS